MSDKRKNALVLEGGGVKCAYQLGFLMGLSELPRFDAVFGASFGAVGAARLLGGGLDSLAEFWRGLTADEMFASPEAGRFMHGLYARERSVSAAALIRALSAYGVSAKGHAELSRRYSSFVMNSVSEQAVRSSGSDLGLVVSEVPKTVFKRFLPGFFTAALDSDRRVKQAKPTYLRLCDIPEGELPSFVAASACFPAFLPIEICGKLYIDGGICDNAPVSMADEYDRVLCIRTNLQRSESLRPGIVEVLPSRELGSCVLFDRENIDDLVLLGEYDAKNVDKAELAPFYE